MKDVVFKRTIITKDDELVNVCNKLMQPQTFNSVDSETTGLDLRRSKLRLVQITEQYSQETFIIDNFKITNTKPLQEFLLSMRPKLCFHGAFDTAFFMHHLDAYIEFPIDLFLAALLLKRYGLPEGMKPDSQEARNAKLVPYIRGKQIRRGDGSLKLKSLMKSFLNIEMNKELQVSNWGGELTDAQLDYAAKDTELLFPLFDVMMQEIIDEGLTDAFATENGCQLATAMLKYYGIKLDMTLMQTLDDEISAKINQAEAAIGEYPEFQSDEQSLFSILDGGITTIDIGSHVQTGKALEKRWGKSWWEKIGLKKPSVQGADLKKMYDKDPELVTLLSERASLQSMYSNQCIGLKSYLDDVTKRVHSSYLQNSSPQQRMSSEDPILLNITNKTSYGPGVSNEDSMMYSKHNFRDLFVAEEGCLFVKSDYGSLQLMALAQESNDPLLIEIFNKGYDIHTITASAIYNRPETQIGKGSAERYSAKTCNYAVGFVCGPERLQTTFAKDDITTTIEECKTFINRYFDRYRGVKEFHKSQPVKVRQMRKVAIHGGRATLFQGDIGIRPTDCVNFPMALYEQSGGKTAASRIARILWRLREHGAKIARIVLMVHDEIMIEIDECYAKAMAEVLERVMIQSMAEYIYKVPIKADTVICKTWGGKAVEPKESLLLPEELVA